MAGARKLHWGTTFKGVATVLSATAATVSIASFVAGRQSAPDSSAVAGLAADDVIRIDLSPSADTAFSLGDTIHFTTLAADAHGQALRAAAVHWSVDDPAVAEVDSSGQVVARNPGVTGVTVAIGGRAGRARLWVAPRLTELAIESDSVIRIAEGATLKLRAVGHDARGNHIPPGGVQWGASDGAVAAIDSAGTLRGITPGTTSITVVAGAIVDERRVEVVPVPASMTLTAGGDQRAAAGQKLPGVIAVQVVSRSGRPVPNVAVRLDASAGMGRVAPDSATTDSHGIAESRWTLGPFPGRQRLAVEVSGIDSALLVTAEADPTPQNTIITLLTDSLAGEAGLALPAAVVLHVTDSAGLALTDVPVMWTALDGGALSLADARTDSFGEVRAHWRLGSKAGPQRARVQVGNPRTLPPTTIPATAMTGPVTSITLVSGDAQSGTVGSALARPLVIRVADSLGNPVEGVSIRLRPQAGKSDSIVRTGKNGVANITWTLGNAAGPVQLVARLDGLADSVVAKAIARPGTAKTIYFAAAPASGAAGRALPKQVQVIVRDRLGNPVPGLTVRFAVASGKASPLQGVTNASGRASTTWTLGPKRGKQSLAATVKSPALRVTHTIVAGAARKD